MLSVYIDIFTVRRNVTKCWWYLILNDVTAWKFQVVSTNCLSSEWHDWHHTLKPSSWYVLRLFFSPGLGSKTTAWVCTNLCFHTHQCRWLEKRCSVSSRRVVSGVGLILSTILRSCCCSRSLVNPIRIVWKCLRHFTAKLLYGAFWHSLRSTTISH